MKRSSIVIVTVMLWMGGVEAMAPVPRVIDDVGTTAAAPRVSGDVAATAAALRASGDVGATAAAPRASVIPQPARVEYRSGVFSIRAGTRLSIPEDPRAARVARYFAALLEQTRGIELVRSTAPAGSETHSIVFRLTGSSSDPEAYAVDVSAERIVLSAGDPRGLLYAAVTLWQLCTSGLDSAVARAAAAGLEIPAMEIQDSPRFPWRGLLLDSARHYQSPEFILQLLDWMALHKLNVLHWHLTDDQAWRLEIRRYPRLTSTSAWRTPPGRAAAADMDPKTGHPRPYGGFYSQETVRRIVAHALERNITIVPEIDMPGHATAAIVAYPRLASVVPAPVAVPSNWGVYSNLYNVDESTFEFLENVLSEVVELFPGRYIHLGGDEAVKDQWKASPRVQARMQELGVAGEEALQSYFVSRMGRFLAARHRRLVGWDEILGSDIPKDAIVTSWRGIDGAVAAAAAGHDAIVSPAPTLYFDNRQSIQDTQPGRGNVITLENVYDFNPLPGALPADQRRHILGLQANVWTEHIRTGERVEYMTFPRAAAVAEIGWTAPEHLDWRNFLARLPDQMARYRLLGIHPFTEQAAVAAESNEPPLRLTSHQLRTCSQEILLSLEDDAPLSGPRAVYLLDIMNPCWIYPAANLGEVTGLAAAVGQVPFQFQPGAGVHVPTLGRPRTSSGELEVRLDGCDGELLADLSLKPALANDGVTELPAAKLERHDGLHDVCLRFTQWTPDPLWALDWVQLLK